MNLDCLENLTMKAENILKFFFKINDVVHFDCHVYDKGGGMGSGKDR